MVIKLNNLLNPKNKSDERVVLATLKKIKYNSKPNKNTIQKYSEEHKAFLEKIKDNKYSQQALVLLSHFKKEFENDDYTKIYPLSEDFKIKEKKLFKSLRLACYRLSKIIRKNE